MLFSVLSREVSAPKSGVKGKAAMCRFSFWDCMAKVIGGCMCLLVSERVSSVFRVQGCHRCLLPTFQKAQSTKLGLEDFELVHCPVTKDCAFAAGRAKLPADLDDTSA